MSLPPGLTRDTKDALRQIRGGLRALKSCANRAAAYSTERAALLDQAHRAALLAQSLTIQALTRAAKTRKAA